MCEASLFKNGECQLFYDHGIGMVLLLLVEFLTRIVISFG